MKYYRWVESSDIKGVQAWILTDFYIEELPDWNAWNLQDSVWIENWNPENYAEYKFDGHKDDFASNAFSIPIFSSQLRILTERLAPGEIQYLPLKILKYGGSGEVRGYCIANILNAVDCIDRELSNYLEWQPGDIREDLIGLSYRDLTKVVLKRSSIGDHKIFRLKMWDILLVVREDIKVAIEKAGLTGCQFREITISL